MIKFKSSLLLMLKTFFFFLMGALLPEKGKRVILLTSLHNKLVQKGVFESETLEKLNSTLCLADSERTLNLPPSFIGRVWDEDKLSQIFVDIETAHTQDSCLIYADAQKVADKIVSLAPAWVRYGSADEMVRDTLGLFYSNRICTSFNHRAAAA